MGRWLPVMCLSVGLGAPESAAVDRALLIGINDYQSDQITDLRGAHNDIAFVRQALTEIGFEQTNIRVLLDQQATREKVLSAIAEAVRNTRADDFLYLHYSGHGSRIEDGSGDEADGLDETIIPQDGRTGSVPDILDDEIDEHLSLLEGTALIVFDSCHSGTITRSANDTIARSVPPDARSWLYVRTRTRAVVTVPELRHVLLTGAADFEEALDGPIEGEYYGFFSYALATAIEDLSRNRITPSTLHDRAKVTLSRIDIRSPFIRRPELQLEGPADLLNRPLFRSEDRPAASTPIDRLLALENPNSALRVQMDLAGPHDCQDPSLQTRGMRTIPSSDRNSDEVLRRIRHEQDPRTTENSLQLRIRSPTQVFLSLLYLDSSGNLTLIFPSDDTSSYLDSGRLPPGRTVCIPDSLRSDNAAGFYWDIAPPTGTDTLLLIANSNLEAADRVRRLVRSQDDLPAVIQSLESLLTSQPDWSVTSRRFRVGPRR